MKRLKLDTIKTWRLFKKPHEEGAGAGPARGHSRTRRALLLAVLAALVVVALGVAAFRWREYFPVGHDHSQASAISHYTCPMHPQIKESKPGKCPICGMDLVPVQRRPPAAPDPQGQKGDDQARSNRKDGSAESSAAGSPAAQPVMVNGVEISPARQQLIGLRSAPVVKKPAFMDIRTSGRVAFDPELAVAIREYLAVRYDPELRSAAVARLRILGMGDEEIRQLPGRGGMYENLYLPSAGGAVWVYANLYEQDMPYVKPGMLAEVSVSHSRGRILTGRVNSLSPVVDPKTRSIRARIFVPKSDVVFRPDSFVNVTIKADLGTVLTIPRSGVLDSGVRQTVFVVTKANHFAPREVQTGPEAGDDVVIVAGLQEGDRVVVGAAFLVDAESNLKAATSGMEGHQH